MDEDQTGQSSSMDSGDGGDTLSDSDHLDHDSDATQQIDDDFDLGSRGSEGQSDDLNSTQTFKNLEELENHIFMNVRKGNLKCLFCGVQLETRQLVLDHMKNAHPTNKIFLCALCDGMFRNHSDLAVHSMEIHALQGYQCAICSHFYQVQSEYQKHYNKQHAGLTLKCNMCHMVFQDGVAFAQHEHCVTCGMLFNNKIELHKHEGSHLSEALVEISKVMKNAEVEKLQNERMMEMEAVDDDGDWSGSGSDNDETNDSNKLLSCALCDAHFQRNRELSRHSKRYHKLSGFKCKTCLAFFQIKSEYKAHPCGGESDEDDLVESGKESQNTPSNTDDDSHSQEDASVKTDFPVPSKKKSRRPRRSNPRECCFCKKVFPSNHKRESHEVEVHTGDYKLCNVCGKKFSNIQGYRIHIRRHTDNGTYKCSLCDKEYPYKASLDYHLYSAHTNERHFTCSICGKTYRRKVHLLHHEDMHKGIASYKCNMCDSVFMTWAQKNRHMQDAHTGRKYKCNVCGKGFTARTHLNTHKVIHTGEKPFKCPQCDARFNRKHHVTQHLQRHFKGTA